MLKSPKINLILASTIILGIIGMFNFTNALIKTPTKSVAQPLYTPPLCTGTTECTSWGLCINELKTCNAGSYTLTPSGCSGGVVSAPTTSCPASENARTVYGYAWSDNVGYISFSGNIGAGAAPAPGPTVPDAPTIGTANAGNGQATVTFTAPASNGGSAITGYVINWYLYKDDPVFGTVFGTSAIGAGSPITVTGLTNGKTYTFTAKAINAVGRSVESAVSNSVTPLPPVICGNNLKEGAEVCDGTALDGQTCVTQLGSGYTGSLSCNGTCSGFVTSSCVAPATVPGAPTGVSATAGNTKATVTFTAPASNGGSAITGYTVTSSPGNITNSSSASPITITGLTNFTTYTFTVKATNGIGVGPASAPSNSITPSLTWSPIMVNTWYYANTYCTNPANGYTRLPVASELQYAMRNNIPNDWPTYEQSSTYWRWWTSTLCTSGYFGSYPCGNPALGGVITGYSGGAWDEYPLNANLSTRFRCVK